MLTISAALRLSQQVEPVSDSARLDCEVLLCHVFNKERVYLYTWPEKLLTEAQQQVYLDYLKRRERGEPVAHITGEKEFWSLPLLVDNTTLIPRPETELLVEIALQLMPEEKGTGSIADLGTGTGAIALALASECPDWQVVGFEKYPGALALAQTNQQRLGLSNVQIRQSDWFSQVGDKPFDIIVANPPYIDKDDMHLSQGDVRFEPKTALVAAQKGLADLVNIVDQAPTYLGDSGWLLLEHGYQQGETVQALLLQRGFTEVSTQKDMAGQPRVTIGKCLK